MKRLTESKCEEKSRRRDNNEMEEKEGKGNSKQTSDCRVMRNEKVFLKNKKNDERNFFVLLRFILFLLLFGL